MRRSRGSQHAIYLTQHAMEIIHLLTDLNPIQFIVDAVINSGPREDATRIGSAGVVRRQAVDISPLRRVNQAIYLLTTGARESAFRNIKTTTEYPAHSSLYLFLLLFLYVILYIYSMLYYYI